MSSASYKPSQQFEDAAKYLSSASSLSRVGNDVKLEVITFVHTFDSAHKLSNG